MAKQEPREYVLMRDAILAEREECCKDICDLCARNIPAVRLGGMTVTHRSSEGCGVWGHKLTAENGETVSLPCEAQMIRGRAENKNKQVVVKPYNGWPVPDFDQRIS